MRKKLDPNLFRISVQLILVGAIGTFQIVESLSIAVFGGSGFLGRRICKELVSKGHQVTSISRSGRPPYYYEDTHSDGNTDWADEVTWLTHTIQAESEKVSKSASELDLPHLDTAISCIGNINPDPDWDKLSFFGLHFNDDVLFQQNGLVNECAALLAQQKGSKRFVFTSVSYEVAKMVEGPIDGYMSGKRHAEHRICELFGEDNSIVLGPSLIYGGKRFPLTGKLYSNFARFGIVKAYVNGMDALRNLSSSPMEDWVEKSIFSPPVDVNVVARVACAGSLGGITKDLVGARRQGFCNELGKDVFYDDVVYVDGTYELERIDELVDIPKAKNKIDSASKIDTVKTTRGGSEEKEPLWEGALIGKGAYLYPLPVIAFFSSIFLGIATGQFTTATVEMRD